MPETHYGENLNSGPSLQRTSLMYQRRRAITACQACRSRKTKCDNVRPVCGFCRRNKAKCVYTDSSKDYSTFDPASLAILDRVNYAISLLEEPPAGASNRQVASEVQFSSPASLSGQGPNASPSNALDDVSGHVTSDDCLSSIPEYPARMMNCEAILRWPVLEGLVPNVQSFILELDDDRPSVSSSGVGGSIQEEDFIPLSKKFLAYVHVKNPILDPAKYRSYVREAAGNGIGWDGPSCLVLITCAVACISLQYQADPGLHASTSEADRGRASAYYLAAKKRLGLIEPSLLSVQCLFLFGVLEMYLLKPIKAWYYFSQACGQFRNHLWRTTQKRLGQTMSCETRRLELRLYWSCMKSECELRCEIPLPSSGITEFGYPNLFPSPPAEVLSPTAEHYQSRDDLSPQDYIEPEEERSWLYYLAEISFRRLMNRAIAALSREGEQGWITNIRTNIKHCEAFEDEIRIWSSYIPPQLNIHDDQIAPNELAYFIHSRAFSCREWVHRPFLYYVIHQPADDPDLPLALPLAQKSLDLCVEGQKHTSPYHRHHGTWYMVRMMLTRALMILAAARSGRLELPADWKEAVEAAERTLKWWEGEAPDFRWAAAVLESVAVDTYARLGAVRANGIY